MTENAVPEQAGDAPGGIAGRFRGYYPVVVDVETAGFDPRTSALLEIAFCTLKTAPDGSFAKDELFAADIVPFPGSVVDPANVAFLGIDPADPARRASDEKTALAPILKAIAKKTREAGCVRAVLVGHNAHFDHAFLMAAAERIKCKRNPFHPFTTIDTAALGLLFFGHSVLSVACECAGVAFSAERAHNAAYDTDREAELFCAMLNRFSALGGWPPRGDDLARVTAAKTRYENRYKKEPEGSGGAAAPGGTPA